MNIEEKLEQIFENVGVTFEQNNELKKKHLLGKEVGMAARDLLIAFFMIEKAFQIQIPEETIVNGEFNTYEHILGTVKKCIGII